MRVRVSVCACTCLCVCVACVYACMYVPVCVVLCVSVCVNLRAKDKFHISYSKKISLTGLVKYYPTFYTGPLLIGDYKCLHNCMTPNFHGRNFRIKP